MLCVRLFGLLLLVVFLCHSIKHTIEQVVVLLQICLPGSPIKFSVMCFSLRDSLRFPNMTFQPIVLTVQDSGPTAGQVHAGQWRFYSIEESVQCLRELGVLLSVLELIDREIEMLCCFDI